MNNDIRCDLITGIESDERLVVPDGIAHGHRAHEAGDFFVTHDEQPVIDADCDDRAFEVITSRRCFGLVPARDIRGYQDEIQSSRRLPKKPANLGCTS